MSERQQIAQMIYSMLNDELDWAFYEVEGDRYLSVADALIEAGYQKVPEGIKWRTDINTGHLTSGGLLVWGGFPFDDEDRKTYTRTVGMTPWKPVEDADE